MSYTTPDDNGSPITSYTVKHRPAGTGSQWIFESGDAETFDTTVSATTTTHDIGGLSPSTRYEFHVAASNANGMGPFSDCSIDGNQQFTTTPTNGIFTGVNGNYPNSGGEGKDFMPMAVDFVEVVSTSNDNVQLRWQMPGLTRLCTTSAECEMPNIKFYTVRYRVANTATEWNTFKTVRTSAAIPMLASATQYEFQVSVTSTHSSASTAANGNRLQPRSVYSFPFTKASTIGASGGK